MSATGIGASVKRTEDIRFITGKGHYVDDFNRPGQAYAYFLRSPHAHATIDKIDASAALKVAGGGRGSHRRRRGRRQDRRACRRCDGLFQGRFANESRRVIRRWRTVRRSTSAIPSPSSSPILTPRRGTRRKSSWSTTACCPPLSIRRALPSRGSRKCTSFAPNNTVFNWHLGDKAATDAAFAAAKHVTKIDLVNNRTIPNAMEPRAALGDYDEGTDVITLHTTSQNPHLARVVLSAFQGVAPENKLRVIAPDVGGGFGSKIFIYNEETVCAWAAKKIKRPVKWTAERTEVVPDGRTWPRSCLARRTWLSMRTAKCWACACTRSRTSAPILRPSGRWSRPGSMRRCCRANTIFPRSTSRSTGSTPTPRLSTPFAAQAARRPPSWSNASSKKPRVRPDTIRRSFGERTSSPRSRIKRRWSLPTTSATTRRRSTRRWSSRTTRASPRARRPPPPRASCVAWDFPPISRHAASPRPRQRPPWASASAQWESAEVRVNMIGTVEVLTGSHSHGQGHETTFAQLVSSRLGIPMENVSIVHGDTDKVQMGMGTYGSRSGAVGMSAIFKALDKIEAKAKKVAGHLLEASERRHRVQGRQIHGQGHRQVDRLRLGRR